MLASPLIPVRGFPIACDDNLHDEEDVRDLKWGWLANSMHRKQRSSFLGMCKGTEGKCEEYMTKTYWEHSWKSLNWQVRTWHAGWDSSFVVNASSDVVVLDSTGGLVTLCTTVLRNVFWKRSPQNFLDVQKYSKRIFGSSTLAIVGCDRARLDSAGIELKPDVWSSFIPIRPLSTGKLCAAFGENNSTWNQIVCTNSSTNVKKGTCPSLFSFRFSYSCIECTLEFCHFTTRHMSFQFEFQQVV